MNDGIATPFVNLFIAGAVAEEVGHADGVGSAAVDLLIGAGIGLAVGLVGAALLHATRRWGWSAPAFRQFAVLGLALLAYAMSIEAGGNGFVGAFIGGLAFGSIAPEADDHLIGFTDDAGELLSLLVWFLFGAAIIVPAFEHLVWQDVAFALLALTVVRMVPVGDRARRRRARSCDGRVRRLVRPRGLASVVFALIAFDSLDAADGDRVLAAVTLTVVLSVVAHGITAAPLGGHLRTVRRRPAPEPPGTHKHAGSPDALDGRRPRTADAPRAGDLDERRRSRQGQLGALSFGGGACVLYACSARRAKPPEAAEGRLRARRDDII